MADSVYGAFTQAPDNVINKHVAVGVESVTSNFEYWTITTAVDIRTSAGGGSTASQANLDKLIEIISLRGQPVIMGNVTGTGPYSLMVAIEHANAWQSAGYTSTTNNALITQLKAAGINYGFGANVNGTDDTGITATPSSVL